MTIQRHGALQRMLVMHGDYCARREWLARKEFVRRMNLGARLVIHNDKLCFVEIEHFAKLFGEEPGQQINDDIRRLKQVLETGEVVRSHGSPEGMGRSILRQRPAQPSESEARL